jgi:pimeloyl-ACP methyl ester carboxylesterase
MWQAEFTPGSWPPPWPARISFLALLLSVVRAMTDSGVRTVHCRVRTFLIEAFMCHTHNAAWHTLHNIICGSAARMDAYLDVVAHQLSCKVALFHGRDDELLPVDCTLAAGARVPRARVTVYDRKDHITIVVGQEKLFAAELEAIWTAD